MTSAPAACDRAAATAEALLFGVVDHADSPADATSAEERAKLAEQRVAAGNATRRDFERAQYDAIAAKYGAKLITRKAYCDEGLPKLQAIADLVGADMRTGQANVPDMIRARREVFRLEATCRSR